MKRKIMIAISVIIVQSSFGQQFTDLYGDYLGQTPPGDTPVIFAPGIISGYVHGTIAISPAGDEIYWTVTQTTERILYSKRENGIWSNPKTTEFEYNYLSNNNGYTAFTPDGTKLFFYSNREGGKGDLDAWYVAKTDTGWSQPINAGEPFNSTDADFTPILTNKGNAYNMRMNPVSHVTTLLCYKYSGGKFTDPSPMDVIPEYSPMSPIFVSPNEDYLIFAGSQNTDLLIRFKDNAGQWGNPVNMGKNINTAQWERFPYISPDGKYLFFIRGGSNSSALFWVSAKIIDRLREKSKIKS